MAEPLVSGWADYLRFRDAFAGILDPATHPLWWLDRQIASGEMLLFASDDAAIIASIRTYPTGLMELEGQAATGNLATIVGDLISTAEQYARQVGCSLASISSRPGWERVMRQYGYELHQVTIRKAL